MNVQLERNGPEVGQALRDMMRVEIEEPAGSVHASNLVEFLQDVSTFLARKDEPA